MNTPPAVTSAPPAQVAVPMMEDPAFQKKVSDRAAVRKELLATRRQVVAKMEAMIEAKRGELKTEDETQLKAALEQDPEWKDLYAKCQDLNTALEDNQARLRTIVGDRLRQNAAQNQKLSK